MKFTSSSAMNKKLCIGIFYEHINENGGYPRDVLRLYKELSKTKASIYKINTFSKFLKIRKKLNTVHIFSLFLPSSIIVILYCILFNIPYIVTTFSHLMPYAMKRKFLKKYLFFFLIGRYMLNKSTAIHAFTSCEESALRELGVKSKIYTIPFGIYPEDVMELSDSCFYSKFIVEKQPYIIFIGRLDVYQKGIDILIDGFLKYIQISKKYRLLICGRDFNGGEKFVVNRIKNIKCYNRIFFLGEINNEAKNILVEKADAFIYPSRFDGPPRPIRFAISKKQKVLVSYQSNIIDDLEKYGWGLQFEANSDSICKSILTFEYKTNWFEYRNPLEILSWKKLIIEYLNMYSRL